MQPESVNHSHPVVIVIIHWGRIEDTIECLTSLYNLEYAPRTVLVVDNGTGAAATLTDQFPWIEMLAFDRNLGFSPAVNHGLDWAREHHAHYAWIINNDTVITDPNCLSKLVTCINQSDAVIASPIINELGKSGQRPNTHELFFPTLALTLHNNAWPAQLLTRLVKHSIFLSGAAQLIDLAKAPIPFFDNRFFAYFEDVDICLRLPLSALATCSDAIIAHKLSKSTGGGLRKHYLKARNLVYLARKHRLWSSGFVIAYWCVFIASEGRKYWREPVAYVKTTMQAYQDGYSLSDSKHSVINNAA